MLGYWERFMAAELLLRDMLTAIGSAYAAELRKMLAAIGSARVAASVAPIPCWGRIRSVGLHLELGINVVQRGGEVVVPYYSGERGYDRAADLRVLVPLGLTKSDRLDKALALLEQQLYHCTETFRLPRGPLVPSELYQHRRVVTVAASDDATDAWVKELYAETLSIWVNARRGGGPERSSVRSEPSIRISSHRVGFCWGRRDFAARHVVEGVMPVLVS